MPGGQNVFMKKKFTANSDFFIGQNIEKTKMADTPLGGKNMIWMG